mgnify:CR=1 FL=1
MGCHEANRAYCRTLWDAPQSPWADAPGWQRESCTNGVYFLLANPTASDAALHYEWQKHKVEEGWKYGPVEDPIKKEHPCLVAFDKLPPDQQMKDRIFTAIVRAFTF